MTDELRDVFTPDRWSDQTKAVPGATWCYLSSDIAAAILQAADAKALSRQWPEVQTSLEQFRKALPRSSDCYLLLVLPTLTDDDFALLRSALDDTLVCRKSLIVTRGRPLSDAIREEFPIVAPMWAATPYAHQQDVHDDDPDEDDLDLLDKRVDDKIADELIERALAALTRTSAQ